MESYNEKNLKPAKLKRNLKLNKDYTFISQSELNKFLVEGRKLYDEMDPKPVNELHADMVVWKPFLNTYKTRGCYSLSRVGFSKDKKFALVLAHFNSGISGDAAYFLFEKINDEWNNPKMFMYSWMT